MSDKPKERYPIITPETYTRETGLQPPPLNTEAPLKRWYARDLFNQVRNLTGDQLDASLARRVQFPYVVVNGNVATVEMRENSVADLIAVNIPGPRYYSPLVLEDTGIHYVFFGNVVRAISPARLTTEEEAKEIAARMAADLGVQLSVGLNTPAKAQLVNPTNDGRAEYNIVGQNVFVNAGEMRAMETAEGVGKPGNWHWANETDKTGLFWMSVNENVTAKIGQSEIQAPLRELDADEVVIANLMSGYIIVRKDNPAVPGNEIAAASDLKAVLEVLVDLSLAQEKLQSRIDRIAEKLGV